MIAERHYDDETLIALMAARGDGAKRDPHLSTCPSCSDALESYRAVSEVLGDAAVWDLKDFRSEPSAKTLEALRSASKQLNSEVHAAGPFVNELVTKPRDSWCHEAAHDVRYHTAGVVRQLVAISEDVIQKDPKKALDLARAATTIVELLNDSDSIRAAVSRARAAAWRQQAYALFFVGEIAEAEDAAERARRALDLHSSVDYDLARVAIVQSVIATAQDRFDVAVKAAREAGRIFAAFGDGRRSASALETEAYALLCQSNYRDAQAILLRITRDFSQFLERDRIAALTTNLALCYWQTGRIAEALDKYQIAIEMHEENGSTADAARTRFNVASVLAAEGQHSEAKRRLRLSEHEFDQLGMHRDAVSTSLLLAEVLLVEGDYGQVEQICRAAIEQFRRTGLDQTTDGLTALRYLTEAAAQNKATPAVARHVIRFFDRLPSEPAALFAPPPYPPPGD